jgi:membrane protein DedA with SNARE-associated domain/membrane-associated phospholipid phosphatase
MHLLDYIADVASRLGHWGYAIIFVVVMLECQAVVGLFMPGESLVLLSGFLAGQGVLDLDAIIIIVSAAAIAGDSIGYELGRHLGRDWLLRIEPWLGARQSQLWKADRYFRQHGGKSVFFSHFLHVLRALMPFMAGASRMHYPRFLVFNSMGCVLWAGVFTLLGYAFGQSWNLIDEWLGRAAAMLGVLLVIAIAVVWSWRWAVQHEEELRAEWRAFIEQPRIRALRRRFAPQIRFLQRRLTPGGYLGLDLTIGAAVIILASWWFGGIVEDLVAHDPLITVDESLAKWFAVHESPAVTRIEKAVSSLGSPGFLLILSIATGSIFAAWRWWYRLLALVLTMGGGALIDLVLKQMFRRPGPGFSHPLAAPSISSFPSSNAMGATLFYLFVAIAIANAAIPWRWRVLAVLIALASIVVIGFTQISLGTHYLSDVLGGIAAGVAWLVFCWTAVETLRRYRRRHSAAS